MERLLADCAGKTRREAEEYLVALRPKPVFAPSIRQTPSRAPEGQVGWTSSAEPQTAASPVTTTPVRETTSPRPPVRTSPSILEPARPDQFNFRFTADRKFKEKFERLAEVLGVENPLQHMAKILEQALDIALDKKDLKRKRARRLERQARRPGVTLVQRSRPDEIFPRGQGGNSRYIPSEVRERVHDRAGHQCEYVVPDGTRCRSRTRLEIEHQRPFALYRSHDERFATFLPGPKPFERGAGLWGGVHSREDRCLSAEALAERLIPSFIARIDSRLNRAWSNRETGYPSRARRALGREVALISYHTE